MASVGCFLLWLHHGFAQPWSVDLHSLPDLLFQTLITSPSPISVPNVIWVAMKLQLWKLPALPLFSPVNLDSSAVNFFVQKLVFMGDFLKEFQYCLCNGLVTQKPQARGQNLQPHNVGIELDTGSCRGLLC